MCLCLGCGGEGGVRWGGEWPGPKSGRVGCSLCGFNHVAPYRYLLHTVYLSVTDIVNPDLIPCGSRAWISHNIVRFYEEQCQSFSGSAWPA